MTEERRHSGAVLPSQLAAFLRQCAPCCPLSFLFPAGVAPAVTDLFLKRMERLDRKPFQRLSELTLDTIDRCESMEGGGYSMKGPEGQNATCLRDLFVKISRP